MTNHWLHNEILDGLSKLLCVSLDRTPAADLIAGTAAAWVAAAERRRAWVEARDRDRVRGAFDELLATRRQWPAPADFLEAFAAQPITQPLLTGTVKPVDPPELVEAMRANTPDEIANARRMLERSGFNVEHAMSANRRRTDGKAAAAGADQ